MFRFPSLSAPSEVRGVNSSPKSTSTSRPATASSGSSNKSNDYSLISAQNISDPLPKDQERESSLLEAPGGKAESLTSSGEPKVGHSSVSSSRTKFGSGRGLKSTVFTLTKDKGLVKSHGRMTGKARGRGHSGSLSKAAVTVGRSNYGTSKDESDQMQYDRPRSGTASVMEAISLTKDAKGMAEGEWEEKREEFAVEQDQSVDGSSADQHFSDHVTLPEMVDCPGLPLRGSGISQWGKIGDTLLADIIEDMTNMKTTEQPVVTVAPQTAGAETQHESMTLAQGGPTYQQTGGVPQQQMTKPKRYSSQRQKHGGGKSGQAMGKERSLCCCSFLIFPLIFEPSV